MLKEIDNITGDTAKKLAPFFSNTVTGAYVLFSLVDNTNVDAAWVQTKNDEVTALIVQKEMSKLYVTTTDNSDYYEIADFISSLGGMVVHCPCEITARIGVTAFSKLSLMMLTGDVKSNQKVENVTKNLRPCFDLITQSRSKILSKGIDEKELKKYTDKAYKQWLSKTSRGITKGYSTVVGVRSDEKSFVSVAIADRLQYMIFIREIAIDSQFKLLGQADESVKALCDSLREDNELVVVACDDIKTENFYKRIGFERKDYLELGIVEL